MLGVQGLEVIETLGRQMSIREGVMLHVLRRQVTKLPHVIKAHAHLLFKQFLQ